LILIGFALDSTKEIVVDRRYALTRGLFGDSFLLGWSFMIGAGLDLRTLMAAASRLVLMCEA
jgi:hypothetical protein